MTCVDADGTPLDTPMIRTAETESEAIAIMRGSIAVARTQPQRVEYTVLDPNNRQLISFTVQGGDDHDPLPVLPDGA